MKLRILKLIALTLLCAGCASQKYLNTNRRPAVASTEGHEACETAARSRVRYYSWEYEYYDCVGFESAKVTSEKILACSQTTQLASSFFECLNTIKESREDVTSDQIKSCGTLGLTYSYCLSRLNSRLTPEKILSCKKGEDVRACLARGASGD